MFDLNKFMKNLDADPVEQIKRLMGVVEESQAQNKETLGLLHARGEMVKIAIAALQRIAIDPRAPRVGDVAKTALDRMKEIWLTVESARQGGSHGQEKGAGGNFA